MNSLHPSTETKDSIIVLIGTLVLFALVAVVVVFA